MVRCVRDLGLQITSLYETKMTTHRLKQFVYVHVHMYYGIDCQHVACSVYSLYAFYLCVCPSDGTHTINVLHDCKCFT